MSKRTDKEFLLDIQEAIRRIEMYTKGLKRIINNIEHITDFTTNICEDIIFLYEAKIIKHHKDECFQNNEEV